MKLSRFAWFSWGVLAYNILVVLWGAVVRATGSGAGCGAHWPRCNGEIVPLAPSVETMVEYSHRLTSGIALFAVVAMLIWAFRVYPAKSAVRRAAVASMIFMILEAALGAALVLFRWVAHDQSLERGVSGGLHLINTFLLLAAITLTAWWASDRAVPRLRDQGILPGLFGGAVVLMLLLGASGGVAALGNTLFPSETLADGIRQDFSSASHLFIQLRVFHPLIAVVTSVYSVLLSWFATAQRPSPQTRRMALIVTVLFVLQLSVGLLNLLLLAPVWIQLIHLFLADMVWLTLVICGSEALSQEPVANPQFASAKA